MDIQIGDDITISGKVIQVIQVNKEQFIIIKGVSGKKYGVNAVDVKTHRPIGREREYDS